MIELMARSGLTSFVLFLLLKPIQIKGLICNMCPSFQPNCIDDTQECGIDQVSAAYSRTTDENSHKTVCSYEILVSGGVRRACEQQRSCETNSDQYSDCNARPCKFCCFGDNCNRIGPSSCRCDTGQCPDRNRGNGLVLFCSESENQIACVTTSTWEELSIARGFYIANEGNNIEFTSCRVTGRQKEISGFTQTINVTSTCSTLRVAQIPRSNGRLRLKFSDNQYQNAKSEIPKDGLRVSCDHIIPEDYLYDWTCNPERVTCSFSRNPPTTIIPTPAPTNETRLEPIVAGGLDFWVYIIIACVTVGVIVLVGFSRNIIKACKDKGYYKVSRIRPWQRRMMAEQGNRQSKLATLGK